MGVGHLGKIHMKLLKELSDVYELVGFYDPDPENAAKVEETYGVPAWDDMEALIDAVDAVDIVTPTLHHHHCAKTALKKFKHVFIEKPVTHTLEEAKSLMGLVREAGVKVQVGHVERYNPAFLSLRGMDLHPMFIEVHRLAQWNPRGIDVSVVLDLMIHDLDIVLSLVDSGVKKVSASGVAVISDTPDIANARIEFNNGCVANLTASRISLKNMRKMRIFQRDTYLTIDFLDKKTEIFSISDEPNDPDSPLQLEFDAGNKKRFLSYQAPEVAPVNSIKMELQEFADAINNDTPSKVPLEEAAAALETAYLILDKIKNLVF